ncbi:protein phosphatase inhibitor 3 [Plasmodium brasilianum]|uniref:Protein phosphatase inhibitor 3, putative n=2 Tax=Plasmodium (Plasmodium) TaxID=418103 RepID=A0A1A8WJJ0_PLAMA|nr:protein phosphatase inhibitor 3, putative [Plasmodium malariae]KAI4837959.1 protein phosphatase inhibitor 3 [Plasmodium brasilianum]SBS92004.1 protein phosphatase inhibitor 3, putative [Plasmodium malariae]SBT71860.1 protein phosphatase inhibitor 3, putative [Plasmodium malariae]SCN45155.1 protein phosphatase inhibitor 3, putative [Plasmodium malariae]
MSHVHSSSTTTTTYVQETNTRNDQNGNQNTIVRILKLSPQKMVRWDDSTVDNENAQKKSSKVCCIYHKPKNFGESSDSDSDSFSSSSERECKSFPKNENKKDERTEEEGIKK